MRNVLRRVLLGSLLTLGLLSGTAATSHAMSFRYSRGWTVQGSWLCYGYPSGVYHCTQRWYRSSSGLYISTTSFVPSQTGVSAVQSPPVNLPSPLPTTGSGNCPGAGLPALGGVSGGMHWEPGGIPGDSCYAVQAAPYGGAISLWKAPPAPFDKVYYVNPALYPSRTGWPVCAWWGRVNNAHYAFGGGQWGMSQPRVGATVRYAPGVLGAGSAGHVGHVVAVYSNGWFLSSEMNFYWRGGGSGRVIFRFVHAQSGVSFVY